jgi:hypothetical protein
MVIPACNCAIKRSMLDWPINITKGLADVCFFHENSSGHEMPQLFQETTTWLIKMDLME